MRTNMKRRKTRLTLVPEVLGTLFPRNLRRRSVLIGQPVAAKSDGRLKQKRNWQQRGPNIRWTATADVTHSSGNSKAQTARRKRQVWSTATNGQQQYLSRKLWSASTMQYKLLVDPHQAWFAWRWPSDPALHSTPLTVARNRLHLGPLGPRATAVAVRFELFVALTADSRWVLHTVGRDNSMCIRLLLMARCLRPGNRPL